MVETNVSLRLERDAKMSNIWLSATGGEKFSLNGQPLRRHLTEVADGDINHYADARRDTSGMMWSIRLAIRFADENQNATTMSKRSKALFSGLMSVTVIWQINTLGRTVVDGRACTPWTVWWKYIDRCIPFTDQRPHANGTLPVCQRWCFNAASHRTWKNMQC